MLQATEVQDDIPRVVMSWKALIPVALFSYQLAPSSVSDAEWIFISKIWLFASRKVKDFRPETFSFSRYSLLRTCACKM